MSSEENKPKRRRKLNMFPEPDFLPAPPRGKFKEEYNRQVFFLALLGASDVQVAQTLGVGVKTVEYWKRTRPEFLKSMKAGKMEADAKVTHSLFLAAVGYSHPDKVVLSNRIKKFNDKGKVVSEYTEPLIVDTVKSYPPNVTAAIKWLKARQPEIWSDRLRVEGNIDHTHKLDLSNFSDDELKVIKKIGMQGMIEDTGYEEM